MSDEPKNLVYIFEVREYWTRFSIYCGITVTAMTAVYLLSGSISAFLVSAGLFYLFSVLLPLFALLRASYVSRVKKVSCFFLCTYAR